MKRHFEFVAKIQFLYERIIKMFDWIFFGNQDLSGWLQPLKKILFCMHFKIAKIELKILLKNMYSNHSLFEREGTYKNNLMFININDSLTFL